MSATFNPSNPTRPAGNVQPDRSTSLEQLRPLLIALAVFVGIDGIGLGIALVVGATLVFNILVFTLFTVLWVAFAAALVFRPATLDDLWHQTRQLPLVAQGVVWLLFLPIMIGLWIWERTWSLPIRLVLVIGLGAWNIFMFFPRG